MLICDYIFFFFFKQKTAYEMRISDWSSDVCSSDLAAGGQFGMFSSRRSTRYLIRNHQKFAIADSKRLMMGGFNISNQYFGTPDNNCWHDLGLLLEGPQ